MDLQKIAMMKARGEKYFHTTANLHLDDVIMFIEMKRKGIIPMNMGLSRFLRAAFHKVLTELYQEAMKQVWEAQRKEEELWSRI